MDWTYSATGIAVDSTHSGAHAEVFAELGDCGTWWTGPERVAMIAHSRAAWDCALCLARREAVSPNAVDGVHDQPDGVVELSEAAVEAVHRISTDPGRLTRAWADGVIAELGAAPYVEIAALVATAYAVDRFAVALGAEVAELPAGGAGEPTRELPAGVGDVGAWVPQTVDKTLANVSRAASLVPAAAETWRKIVQAHYSRGADFVSLTWDRPLSRPQVEVVAAAVSEANECFY